jgi:LysR family transcriptional regulator, transcriptional activator for bauABCD operon
MLKSQVARITSTAGTDFIMGQRKVKLGRVTDVDLRLLRIFQTVVDCGGLSAAEIDLGIGRSTISTHIAELEGRLGTRLCQRGRRGFALTSRGKKIYEASLGLMKSLDVFRNEVNDNEDAMAGELNIGICDNIIWDKEAQLPQVFQNFSAIGSEVDLTLYVLSPDEIERRLVDGRLHIGIACVMHKLTSLSYEHLFDEVNYLYCGREHPLFNIPDSDITTADLVRSQYVKKGYAVNSDLQQANTDMGKRVVGFHVEAFALLILSGRYIGFLPEHYASIWEDKGEVRKLHPKRYEAVVNFSIMTAQARPHTAAQTAFLAILRKATEASHISRVAVTSAVA